MKDSQEIHNHPLSVTECRLEFGPHLKVPTFREDSDSSAK